MGINTVKRVLSFIWPIISKVESQHNGTLEVAWYNGKKMLNSKNANYSYGKLQKALIYGLSKLEINTEAPILILGLGGGSIIRPLRNKFECTGKITAVEWDEMVADLARTEFGINSSFGVDVILADAFNYTEHCTEKYGLIIIDLFLDDTVPEVFYGAQFWENVMSLVQRGGSILFNAGIHGDGGQQILEVERMLLIHAEVKIFNKVQGFNTLMLAQFFD